MKYSLIDKIDMSVVRKGAELGEVTPPDFTGHPTKSNLVWVPYTFVPLSSLDNKTEVTLPDEVVISAQEHTITEQKRSKTQAELDAELEEKKDSKIANFEKKIAMAAALLNHENRIRVLEGNPTPATMKQLKTFLRNHM